MKFILTWHEGRQERRTEMDIPEGLTLDEIQKYLMSAVKKAYRYSDEPLPKDVVEGDL